MGPGFLEEGNVVSTKQVSLRESVAMIRLGGDTGRRVLGTTDQGARESDVPRTGYVDDREAF